MRGKWENIAGLDYRGKIVDVELNLATDKKEKVDWVNVRLLFVRGQCEGDKPSVDKKDWAVFLTSDMTMEAAKILKVYAMRWGIEVYFKFATQHLGFLKEQTETFASHIASIYMAAIRYLMLVQAKLEHAESRVCDVRNYLNKQLETVDFAKHLWGLFQTIISSTLEGVREQIGSAVDIAMSAIEESIQGFFVQVLQLDTFTMQLEAKDCAELDD
ncbi:transposase [Candidatus Parabeggiatoa sp. HSG14]|uniref:transposase n=1 Tax=Candidatus Parabeggiatoa sp. HSG14 TaxID=3055593 RepID=UPI0025A6E139|nr:transposase [Thiotrichales bacterium HSG14]